MELSEVERRMRPGGWYSKPLLRVEEVLEARLRKDANSLQRLGLDSRQLGAQLAELIAGARQTDWFRPIRRKALSVEVRRRRGLITCSWAEEEFKPCAAAPEDLPTANEFVLRNSATNTQISSFVLVAHLVRVHGFFGGTGTVYRIEPEALAQALQQRR